MDKVRKKEAIKDNEGQVYELGFFTVKS